MGHKRTWCRCVRVVAVQEESSTWRKNFKRKGTNWPGQTFLFSSCNKRFLWQCQLSQKYIGSRWHSLTCYVVNRCWLSVKHTWAEMNMPQNSGPTGLIAPCLHVQYVSIGLQNPESILLTTKGRQSWHLSESSGKFEASLFRWDHGQSALRGTLSRIWPYLFFWRC